MVVSIVRVSTYYLLLIRQLHSSSWWFRLYTFTQTLYIQVHVHTHTHTQRVQEGRQGHFFFKCTMGKGEVETVGGAAGRRKECVCVWQRKWEERSHTKRGMRNKRKGSLLCSFAHGQTYTSRKGESTYVKGLKPEKDKGDGVHKSLLVRCWGGPQYVVPLYLCDQTAYLAFLRHQLFCWKSSLMFSCLRELIQPVVSFPTFPRACVHINMWLCIWYPGDKTQFS